ncbi:hypothetical protein NIES4103_55270 [Nostoc sp. NIES-4103]|nr:hypothetical protein NIES4103_55270 [Nostoc sp. NIES-4103]
MHFDYIQKKYPGIKPGHIHVFQALTNGILTLKKIYLPYL